MIDWHLTLGQDGEGWGRIIVIAAFLIFWGIGALWKWLQSMAAEQKKQASEQREPAQRQSSKDRLTELAERRKRELQELARRRREAMQRGEQPQQDRERRSQPASSAKATSSAAGSCA